MEQRATRKSYSAGFVRDLFDSIARRYDFLNHALSLGLDCRWRHEAVVLLRQKRPARVLDVATGTGDLALGILREGQSTVVGVDISRGMLDRARRKLRKRGGILELVLGQAERLPFRDGTFDAVTVAFGVRNFEDLEAGSAEMQRVLAREGICVILEFSRPRIPLFGKVFDVYFHRILPRIGHWASSNRFAYRYLPATVDSFPDGPDFEEILRRSGFRDIRSRRLTFGVATVYSAVKRLDGSA